jgi:hypothetical protein
VKSLIGEYTDNATIVLNNLVVEITVKRCDGQRKLLVPPSWRLEEYQLPCDALARLRIVIRKTQIALINLPCCCSNIIVCGVLFALIDLPCWRTPGQRQDPEKRSDARSINHWILPIAQYW